ncbi:hypothetical protein SSX86_028740 [Deinandra increscens subsp. villosa]|uniref:SAM domain-containing protein n=1 Tax=Deinandra increscens subsp. villosa TaxID=3103831 RepID=A0AAP0CDJ0_9ASTR
MEDTSRSQVTITLGRSGQVVKRSGAVVDDEFLDPVPAAGIKRSVRDRLGGNGDTLHLDNKRFGFTPFLYLLKLIITYWWQRGVNGRLSSNASNGVDDTHLSKHDLRFKIMKKSGSQRNGKQKNVDLRDMLSLKARSSVTNHKDHQSLPEPGNGRQREQQLTPEQKDERRCMPEPQDGQWDPDEVAPRDDRRLIRAPIEVGSRDDRLLIREPVEVGPRDDRRLIRDPVEVGPRDDRRFIRTPVEVGPRDDRRIIRDPIELGPRDDRRLIRPPIEVGSRMHKLYDDRQPNLDLMDGSMPSRPTSTRTSRSLSQMDLSKTSFSLKPSDHISCPSSHKGLDSSSGLLLPPTPMEEPLRRPLMRAFHDPRTVPYPNRDIHEIPGPMATYFPIKPAISDGPTKPVGPLIASQLPTGGMAEYLTVETFLHSLGLDKYLISFKVEEVDMTTLSQMKEQDFKEMGIPMGPRKKIMLALALHARNRRQVQ